MKRRLSVTEVSAAELKGRSHWVKEAIASLTRAFPACYAPDRTISWAVS